MNPETDRIPVPANGTGLHGVEAPAAPTAAPPPDQVTVAFTPAQLAVGFGIVAALVLFLVKRIRRGGGPGRGDSGGR